MQATRSGKSLIVVEHDQETIEAADYVVDFGPSAGIEGGMVCAQGSVSQLKRSRGYLKGRYLSGKLSIEVPEFRRVVKRNIPKITIEGARENNLKDINVDIPLGVLTVVTGVSGADKSTIINQILYPAIARKLHNSEAPVGDHFQGDGSIKVEMHFIADVFVPCEVCYGKRFNSATCEILYKGKSIADFLDLSVSEARQHFTNHKKSVRFWIPFLK